MLKDEEFGWSEAACREVGGRVTRSRDIEGYKGRGFACVLGAAPQTTLPLRPAYVTLGVT